MASPPDSVAGGLSARTRGTGDATAAGLVAIAWPVAVEPARRRACRRQHMWRARPVGALGCSRWPSIAHRRRRPGLPARWSVTGPLAPRADGSGDPHRAGRRAASSGHAAAGQGRRGLHSVRRAHRRVHPHRRRPMHGYDEQSRSGRDVRDLLGSRRPAGELNPVRVHRHPMPRAERDTRGPASAGQLASRGDGLGTIQITSRDAETCRHRRPPVRPQELRQQGQRPVARRSLAVGDLASGHGAGLAGMRRHGWRRNRCRPQQGRCRPRAALNQALPGRRQPTPPS